MLNSISGLRSNGQTHLRRLSAGASLSVLASVFAPCLVNAQQAAPNSSDLPPVTVLGTQSPKKMAKAKKPSTVKQKAPAQASTNTQPAEPVVDPAQTGVNTPTKPGLNLSVPTTAGSRLNLTPLETPASVSVISGEVARDRGQDTVTDAVTHNAPGFSSVANPVYGQAFASRGYQGNGSVVRLYDGTRISPGRGNVTFPFNMWSVDRIEVLHGPASVLYGQGAIGGVINVVPKKPITTHYENEAQVYVDSNLGRRLSFDSAGPLNEALSYRFDVTGDASEGWVDLGHSENFGISGALRLQAAPDLVFTLSTDYGDQKPMRYFGTPFRDGEIDKSLREKNYNVYDSRIRFKDNFTQLKTEYTPSSALSFRNISYISSSNREWRNAEDYFLNPVTGDVDRSGYIHIVQQQDQIGTRNDATVRSRILGFANESVVGFDITRTRFGYSNYIPSEANSLNPYNFDRGFFPNPDRLDPKYKSELTEYGVFAENRIHLLDNLTIVGGVRFDAPTIEREDVSLGQSFEKTFGALGWRVGAVYEPIRNFAFFGQYTVGTDPINVPLLDLAKNFAKFGLTTGNQVEVGMKQSFWNGRGEWTLAGYRIEKNDLIVLDASYQFQQIGQQSSYGVEASGGLELGYGWRIDANAAWLKAQYDDFQYIDFSTFAVTDYSGKTPILIPEQTANIWLSWAFAQGWKASGGVQYIGSSYENFDNTVERPAYTIVNAGLQWKPTDMTTIDFRVQNVFDKVYAEYLKYDDPASGGLGGLQGYLGQPRTFSGAVTVKF
ncbi:TonB-dependent siderophore receptor [Hyphomicrobium methylovorum]|uniref:TonB-dependent receptor n=1 Tax=Hyphomicrobium methylovorum TaxID=84 RepID=UPI0015E6ABE2|nr:TonB-dependent receptor [Hyphomicrobium methylovorum]MBA2125897.1 TonB-dependent siderophore receptor [Hyphomicrobium methylovorum]